MRMVVILTLTSFMARAEWAPPEKPDPQAILLEARADQSAARYDVALAKHVWFHQNALKFNKALYGVRLSFALADWKRLSDVHPPALAKLKAVREEARKEFLKFELEKSRQLFHDIEAINKALADDATTVDLFAITDEENALVAKSVSEIARPALLRAKKYALYTKYLEVDAFLEKSRFNFKRERERAANNNHPILKEFAERSFVNEISTLLALLVLDKRKTEATEIANKVRQDWNNEGFFASIESALEGIVPEPWP